MKVRYGLLITMTDIMASNWSGGGSPPPPNGFPLLDRTGQPKNHELSPSGVPTPIYNKWKKFLHSWFSDLIRLSGLQNSDPYILLMKEVLRHPNDTYGAAKS